MHTFVSNLQGPDQPMTFGGAPVTSVVPIAMNPGDARVSFGVLS